MNVVQILEQMRDNPRVGACVTAWRYITPRAGTYQPFPAELDPALVRAVRRLGIDNLYSHQEQAIRAILGGKHVVIVTPTASGKTLCYNLPVLDSIMRDGKSRAIYLFPTKALSEDQRHELHALIDAIGLDIKTWTYDGDTPASARKLIRTAGHIVLTNPDMLHTGILPHHTKWVSLFENLDYVVIDELHCYRGIFGSHVANVLRRLKRVCRFYGSSPRFICCSATIANPAELARRLTEEEVELVDESGAPTGGKHFLLYNPPVVNRQLGLRRSSVLEAVSLATNFLANKVQTIVFARSRLASEVILRYLREAGARRHLPEEAIRGYRGGYLPLERRAIEKGLREKNVLAVASTNALELGIDIGSLEACVMVGYPGTICSTWQQAGRVGRRTGDSAVVLVASSAPLDQYIVNHPAYFFERSPEHGLINPDNLPILVSHLKCAAFELPFAEEERFGVETTREILDYLESERVLHRVGTRWHWTSASFPADEISLRSASAENFVVVDTTDGSRVIGEVDRFSAPMLIHEEAIYMHAGEQYQVEKLDYAEKKAYVRRVEVDYYTDANLAVNIKVLDTFRVHEDAVGSRAHGEVLVSGITTMFKKIKFHTHENVGSGPVHLPEEQMHTSAYWLAVNPPAARQFGAGELESALAALANVLVNVAPIYLMCDPRDIRGVCEVRSPFTGRPTIFLYDNHPGGVGFSQKLFELHADILRSARELIEACGCESGCPSCVGPAHQVGSAAKRHALILLREVLTGDGTPPEARVPVQS